MSEQIPVAYSSMAQYPFRIGHECLKVLTGKRAAGTPESKMLQKVFLTYNCPSGHYPNIPDNTELLHTVLACVDNNTIEARFLFSCDNEWKLDGCASFVAEQARTRQKLGVRAYPFYPPHCTPSGLPIDFIVWAEHFAIAFWNVVNKESEVSTVPCYYFRDEIQIRAFERISQLLWEQARGAELKGFDESIQRAEIQRRRKKVQEWCMSLQPDWGPSKYYIPRIPRTTGAWRAGIAYCCGQRIASEGWILKRIEESLSAAQKRMISAIDAETMTLNGECFGAFLLLDSASGTRLKQDLDSLLGKPVGIRPVMVLARFKQALLNSSPTSMRQTELTDLAVAPSLDQPFEFGLKIFCAINGDCAFWIGSGNDVVGLFCKAQYTMASDMIATVRMCYEREAEYDRLVYR